MIRSIKAVLAFCTAAILLPAPAHAAYTINVVESGGSVVATGSGTLNLSALTITLPSALSGSQLYAAVGNIVTGGDFDPVPITQYGNVTGPGSFGTGLLTLPNLYSPVTPTGAVVGIISNTDSLFVPYGYVSGSDLGVSKSTYSGKSFASLGLATGSYKFSWGQGASADTFTVNVGPVTAAVPEPATWALMILGFGIIGFSMRRQPASRYA